MPVTNISRRGFLTTVGSATAAHAQTGRRGQPNFIFILTDDHRWDALGSTGNSRVQTPHMDALAARGVRFSNAFVTMSVCSASRAAILTGRYGSRNGVMGLDASLRAGETTFARTLRDAGYRTGYVGKWHLRSPKTPEDGGFQQASWFYSNGPHFNRKVTENGVAKVATGFLEDYLAERSVAFLRESATARQPFFLHLSTQVPHLDHEFRWNPKPATAARYRDTEIPLPDSWNDTLRGKPEYLRSCRNRTQGLKYGYDNAAKIRDHIRSYYAAITDLDACLGRVFGTLRELGLEQNTYVMLMGDNGWFLGEHGFTSKVLPYEESVRVPLLVAGPGIRPAVRTELALNVDIAPTVLEWAGLAGGSHFHGSSLRPLVEGSARGRSQWRRDAVLYEALRPELGSRPLLAVRDSRWKYITTMDVETASRVGFEELYDLEQDPLELQNLAAAAQHAGRKKQLQSRMAALREAIAAGD